LTRGMGRGIVLGPFLGGYELLDTVSKPELCFSKLHDLGSRRQCIVRAPHLDPILALNRFLENDDVEREHVRTTDMVRRAAMIHCTLYTLHLRKSTGVVHWMR
jgi:hypothetical protein